MSVSFWARSRPTLALATPIIAGQVSQMAMGLVDSAMVGRVGVVPLAASAFANTLIAIPLVWGIGLMMALGIRVSQTRGAQGKNPAVLSELLRHGMALALLMGVVLALGVAALGGFLDKFGQSAEVATQARPFLLLVGASLPFVLLTFSLKNFCEALENPWPPTLILSAAVPLNVLFNWFLIFGNAGAPALGLTGAGVATLAARVVSFVGLWFYVTRAPQLRAHWPARWNAALRWQTLKNLLQIGIPASLQIVLEVGAFSLGALMVGWLGAKPLAAHQIVLACASTTFMVPLGLSMAASIRVGAVSHEPERARAIGSNALVLALISSGLSAAFYLAFRHQIARAFVDDPFVAQLAATLFLVVAIFQIVDGVQVTASGLLRGMSDATVPMLSSLASYWLVGLPFGYIAAFRWGWGALGVWIGLAIALGLVAVALTLRFWKRSARARNGFVEVCAERFERA